MRYESKDMQKYLDRALFAACVVLIFVLLIMALVFQKSKVPSVTKGSTEAEINNYAYELLESSPNEVAGKSYLEATSYYLSQISLAKEPEQRFNLQLGMASFFGRTGDPVSGIGVLDSIDTKDLAPDALYYLYSTYIYLYQRNNDEVSASSYRQRIIDEGIYDYIAKLDAGEIVPLTNDEEEDEDEEISEEDEE